MHGAVVVMESRRHGAMYGVMLATSVGVLFWLAAFWLTYRLGVSRGVDRGIAMGAEIEHAAEQRSVERRLVGRICFPSDETHIFVEAGTHMIGGQP